MEINNLLELNLNPQRRKEVDISFFSPFLLVHTDPYSCRSAVNFRIRSAKSQHHCLRITARRWWVIGEETCGPGKQVKWILTDRQTWTDFLTICTPCCSWFSSYRYSKYLTVDSAASDKANTSESAFHPDSFLMAFRKSIVIFFVLENL